jgi:hypothetical protein
MRMAHESPRLALATWLHHQARVRRWQRKDVRARDPLEALADFVLALPEDDPRLLELATLMVRHGVFWPGPAVEDTLLMYAGGLTGAELSALLHSIGQLAVEDALDRARAAGVLP